jgi:hypothetical protein
MLVLGTGLVICRCHRATFVINGNFKIACVMALTGTFLLCQLPVVAHLNTVGKVPFSNPSPSSPRQLYFGFWTWCPTAADGISATDGSWSSKLTCLSKPWLCGIMGFGCSPSAAGRDASKMTISHWADPNKLYHSVLVVPPCLRTTYGPKYPCLAFLYWITDHLHFDGQPFKELLLRQAFA